MDWPKNTKVFTCHIKFRPFKGNSGLDGIPLHAQVYIPELGIGRQKSPLWSPLK